MTTAPLRTLLSIGWLADEPEPFRAAMVALGQMVRFARGKALYTAGDPPAAIFGIGTGHVDVSLPVADDEEVLVHRGGPGFWVGDSALLAGAERGLTITAATDCEVLCLPGPAVRAHLAERPGDWPAFFRLNHRNTMLTVIALAEALSLPPEALFARTLLRIADAEGRVAATQEDLARLTGMSRASFRRAMGKMIAAGVLQPGYGRITIADRARLAALARHPSDTGMASITDRA